MSVSGNVLNEGRVFNVAEEATKHLNFEKK